MYEVTNRTQGPYSAICYVRCTWSDGTVTAGSGVVVGPNDVLTALHVVTPSGFKTLQSLYVVPGADTWPVSNPYGVFHQGGFNEGTINARAANWDLDSDGLLSPFESSRDLALLGFSSNIAALSGSLPTTSTAIDFNGQIVGFPARGTGMMAEQVNATAGLGVYNVTGWLGPGSSGGPLLQTGTDGNPYVAGVASGGDAARNLTTYAGLSGFGNAAWLASAIAGNDHLLGIPVSTASGGYGDDAFSLHSMKAAPGGITISDFGGNDSIFASGEWFSRVQPTLNIDLAPGSEFTFLGKRFLISATTTIENVTTDSAPDTVVGNAASNKFETNGGNDTMTGRGGADTLDGGFGIDTAVYFGLRSDYRLTMAPGWVQNGFTLIRASVSVSDRLSTRDGTDKLMDVERLKFSDTMLAIDLTGNAGMVAKLLGAVFGKTAVANKAYVGFGLAMLDGGMSYAALAQAAVNAKLGAAPGHAQVVELLYTNLVGSAPGAADLAAYTRLLDNRTHTPASLAMLAADSPANLTNVNYTGLAANGLEYTLA